MGAINLIQEKFAVSFKASFSFIMLFGSLLKKLNFVGKAIVKLISGYITIMSRIGAFFDLLILSPFTTFLRTWKRELILRYAERLKPGMSLKLKNKDNVIIPYSLVKLILHLET